MLAGISVRNIIENHIRMCFDDYGYGDVTIHADEKTTWVLYRHGNLVGKASYDLDNVIIQLKA